ncbi:hypothetical protein, partial [Undibacterium sp. TJN19]|uniref:hypothetical protein n=1 Tax=Undibacterium sp. TJN19 TaxID=3413055 RepID=UPI003BF3C5E0
NRTVKRLRANDSAATSVKVGYRQACIPHTPDQAIDRGFCFCANRKSTRQSTSTSTSTLALAISSLHCSDYGRMALYHPDGLAVKVTSSSPLHSHVSVRTEALN